MSNIFYTDTGSFKTIIVSDSLSGTASYASSASYITTSNIDGIMSVANGGTGLSTLSIGRIPFGNGTSAFGNSANAILDGNGNLSISGSFNIKNSSGILISNPSAPAPTVASSIYVAADTSNTLVNALYITAPGNTKRIFFGDASNSPFSLNFSHVNAFENVPSSFYMSNLVDANTGRSGSKIRSGPVVGLDLQLASGLVTGTQNPNENSTTRALNFGSFEDGTGQFNASNHMFSFNVPSVPPYINFSNVTTSIVHTAWSLGTTNPNDNTKWIMILNTDGNLSVGAFPSASARIHAVGTSEQLRIGYNTSSYYSTTVNSTGNITFDAVGTGAGFTFQDNVTITGLLDICNGYGNPGSIEMGADVNAITRTNNTRKVARLTVPAYGTASSRLTIFGADNDGTTNNSAFFGTVPGSGFGIQNMIFATTPDESTGASTYKTAIVARYGYGIGIGDGYRAQYNGITYLPNATLDVRGDSSNSTPLFIVASSNGPSTQEFFRINNSGSVGIGTSSPTNSLDVSGNISCSVITASLLNGTALSASYLNSPKDIILNGYIVNGTNLPITSSILIGNQAGLNYNSYNGVFIGDGAGRNATASYRSTFIGYYAGDGATGARTSQFVGTQAGQNATYAYSSNFFGTAAGLGAIYASFSNMFGDAAGQNAISSSNSNFFGLHAGYFATNAGNSNFFGNGAGNGATNASLSNIFGAGAGDSAINANGVNFFGYQAGSSAAAGVGSNFFGNQCGYFATSASYSNFIGYRTGYQASNADNSNFIGYSAGYQATYANQSNFIGRAAGQAAVSASYSNFIGFTAGTSATNANYSVFIGYTAGYTAINANNSIFIGYNSGKNDTVNNTGGKSSILIGDYTLTGGNSDSIAIGKGTKNSSNNQLNIGNVIYASNIYSGSTSVSTPQTNGLVGIGINNPTNSLDVAGNISCSVVTASLFNGTALTASNLATPNPFINNLLRVPTYVTFEDDFIFGNLTDGQIGSLGWNMNNGTTAEISNTDYKHPGIISLTCNAGTWARIRCQGSPILSASGSAFEMVGILLCPTSSGVNLAWGGNNGTVGSNAFPLFSFNSASSPNWFISGVDTNLPFVDNKWYYLHSWRFTNSGNWNWEIKNKSTDAVALASGSISTEPISSLGSIGLTLNNASSSSYAVWLDYAKLSIGMIDR